METPRHSVEGPGVVVVIAIAAKKSVCAEHPETVGGIAIAKKPSFVAYVPLVLFDDEMTRFEVELFPDQEFDLCRELWESRKRSA